MDEWVVRAGIASADFLITGYGKHKGYAQQQIYGFSVQYNPGSSIADLAKAGEFPNGSISYAQKLALEQALYGIGYTMKLLKTKGTGYHHTLIVIYDANGNELQILPQPVAEALSKAFQRMKNPHRVYR